VQKPGGHRPPHRCGPPVSESRRDLLSFQTVQCSRHPWDHQSEREVTAITAQRLRPYHIVFDNISLRTIEISRLSAALSGDSRYRCRRAKGTGGRLLLSSPARTRKAPRRRPRRGKSDTAIAPTLTPAMLEDTANRACRRLLTAPSTHVEVRPSEQPYLLEVEP